MAEELLQSFCCFKRSSSCEETFQTCFKLVAAASYICADVWEGDATKRFSVKKGLFSEKRGGNSVNGGFWQGFLQERQFNEEVRAIL